MIKTFSIGVMVICHLLTGNKVQQEDGTQKEEIKKILGLITATHTRKEFIEKPDTKEALSYDQTFLIVKENLTGNSYEIKKNACMIIRDESDEERSERLHPRKKIDPTPKKTILIAPNDAPNPEELTSNQKVFDTVKEESIKLKDSVNVTIKNARKNSEEATKPEVIKEKIPTENKKNVMDYLKE